MLSTQRFVFPAIRARALGQRRVAARAGENGIGSESSPAAAAAVAGAPPSSDFFKKIYVDGKASPATRLRAAMRPGAQSHVRQAGPPQAEKKTVPWDIGAHQPALELVAGSLRGRVLDVGCGTGDNARWVAALPGVTAVTAIDCAPGAIQICRERQARQPAPLAAAAVEFLQADVFALPADLTDYDTWLDSAVFHCIGDDGAQAGYLAAVTPRMRMGATAIMLVFSDLNPDPWVGPRRIGERHARALWTQAGWDVRSLSMDAWYADSMGRNDGKGGRAMLMVAKRVR